MYNSLRPLLFHLDPERAHALTLKVLRYTGNFKYSRWLLSQIYRVSEKPVEAFGLTFKNPVGLAAGYDKDALAFRGLGTLGFGHIEIGTVTSRPQQGNPSPRMFRLLEDEAIINRLGFPSRGTEFVQKRLSPALRESWFERYFGIAPRSKKKKPKIIEKGKVLLGVNIGKNKTTPNEEAVMDYVSLVDNFAPYADYIAINVSSPNTEGLRQLQERDELEKLLTHIHQQRTVSEKLHEKKLPILVKLAPDLNNSELDDAIDAILRTNMDGIIVTNTTLAREKLRSMHQREAGGLSGSPLTGLSEAILHQTVKCVAGKIPVVSVGGIMCPMDAKKRLDMGATLIQIYTGLIYHGPGLVKQILKSL